MVLKTKLYLNEKENSSKGMKIKIRVQKNDIKIK